MPQNYSSLVTAWNNASLASGATLPTGVTGSLLTGMTTMQKIAAVNAWLVTGPALTPDLPIKSVIACIQSADLLALTTAQSLALQIVMTGSNGLVYSPIGGTVRSVFATIFSGKTATLNALAALVALYDTPQIPWITAPLTNNPPGAGLSAPISINDTQAVSLT